MKPFLASVLAFAAFSIVAASADDRIAKSFNVKAGGSCIVDADRGSIDILTGNTDTVEVEVLRKLNPGLHASLEDALAQHVVEVTQEGDAIRVHAAPKNRITSVFKAVNQLNVHYTIKLPRSFKVDLGTAGGSIKVADLDGTIKARTSGGSIHIANAKATVFGRTSGGSIDLQSTAADADLQTSGGSIKVGTVHGKLNARTSGGSIHVANAEGPVEAHTSGGRIDLQDAKAAVNASTSGGSISARLSGQPMGDCQLKTSGGSIDFAVKPDLALNLDAATSGGGVTSNLPLNGEVEVKKNAVRGQLNGGGKVVQLRTTGGSIHLKKI